MHVRSVCRGLLTLGGLTLAGVLLSLCSKSAAAGGQPMPAPVAVDDAARDVVSDVRGSDAPDAAPACIHWTTDVRYRPYGYDHLVRIDNACGRAATCQVSTNVNPSPITVRVPQHESVTVVTFQGSPARTFSANVACRLE